MKLISNPEPPHECDIKPEMKTRQFGDLEGELGGILRQGAIVECSCGQRWEYMGTSTEYDRWIVEITHLWRKVAAPNLLEWLDR